MNLSAKLNARSGGVPQASTAPGRPVGGLLAAPFAAAGAVVGRTVGAAGAGAMTSDAQNAVSGRQPTPTSGRNRGADARSPC